jgi:ABC-type Fe3+ transport system permease subunit
MGMKPTSVSFLTLSIVLMVSTFALAADQAKVDRQRQEMRQTSRDVFAQLYKAEPSAKPTPRRPRATPCSATSA